MTFEPDQQFVQVSDLEAHEADDGLIVFNSASDKVHHLNPSAGILFELCRNAVSVADLAQQMGALYELDEPPLDAVTATLAQLVDEGVLATHDGE
ncbi:MAG: PqqD family protein [Pseudomonadota bacterium]